MLRSGFYLAMFIEGGICIKSEESWVCKSLRGELTFFDRIWYDIPTAFITE